MHAAWHGGTHCGLDFMEADMASLRSWGSPWWASSAARPMRARPLGVRLWALAPTAWLLLLVVLLLSSAGSPSRVNCCSACATCVSSTGAMWMPPRARLSRMMSCGQSVAMD